MKKIVLSFFLLFLSLNGFGQNNLDSTVLSPKHFIGLHAGNTTGRGISYRYWPSKFGFQTTFAFEKRKSYNRLSLDIGLSLLYKLKENEKFGVYAYLGHDIDYNQHETWGGQPITTIANLQYNIGIGVGFKANILKNLDANIQFGYALLDLTQNFHSGLAGEIGLYYHF